MPCTYFSHFKNSYFSISCTFFTQTFPMAHFNITDLFPVPNSKCAADSFHLGNNFQHSKMSHIPKIPHFSPTYFSLISLCLSPYHSISVHIISHHTIPFKFSISFNIYPFILCTGYPHRVRRRAGASRRQI